MNFVRGIMHQLTPFERFEITNIHTREGVFYWGVLAKGRKISPPQGMPIYLSYDDKHGHYKIIINDHLFFRYRITRILGKGTFGTVVEAIDHKYMVRVAIKIARRGEICDEICDQEAYFLDLIHRRSRQKNRVVKLLNRFHFRLHSCMVLEYLGNDVYKELMMSKFFDSNRLKNIAKSLIEGVSCIHSLNIIHADLKPVNLALVNGQRDHVKLIDFGSAMIENERQDEVATYFQTRYYRAPEVIMRLHYNKSIDVWSLGCIVYELLARRFLFPGINEKNMMELFVRILGAPPKELVLQWMKISPTVKRYFNKSGEPYFNKRLNKLPLKLGAGSALKIFFNNEIPQAAIEFLETCLKWNPDERVSAKEALNHRWLVKLSLPSINRIPNRSTTHNLLRSVSLPEISINKERMQSSISLPLISKGKRYKEV